MATASFISTSESCFRSDSEKVRALLYRNYSIAPHSHDFYEINVVVNGKGIHTIEDNNISVSRGSVFVIPPMVVHGYSHTENLDVYHLLIKSELLKNTPDLSKVEGFELLTEIEPFLRTNFTESLFLKLPPAQLMDIKSEIEELSDGNFFDYDGADTIRNYIALKIICLMSHLLTQQLHNPDKSVSLEKEMSIISAIKYIHEHYSEKITIQKLSDITFMSRSTFIRNFKAICGCPPMSYLQTYRRKMALELLKDNKNKTFVAHECGFYDLSHMEKGIKANKITVKIQEHQL